MVTKEDLYNFENWTVNTFNDGQLKSPVHLSGSIDGKLEDWLIGFFNQVKSQDWVITTYRSHYHALLKGVPEGRLKKWILDNKSIHFMDNEYKMFSSAIVGGTLPVALGVALGIKLNSQQKKNKSDDTLTIDDSYLETRSETREEIKDVRRLVDADNHVDPEEPGEDVDVGKSPRVFCFVGDMTSQTGIFHEVFKYAVNHKLPIKFIIECNFLSTDTDTAAAWGSTRENLVKFFEKQKNNYPEYFDYIVYERKYPHYGTGKFVAKIWEGVDETKQKGF